MANAYHTKEKYAQIAEKLRGQKRSQETKDKISQSLMGHKVTSESLAKMRKPRSEQGRKNISKGRMGKTPWNKNIKGDEYKKHYSKGMGGQFFNGRKPSKESIEKTREGLIKFFKSQSPNYIPPTYEEGEIYRKHERIRRSRMKANGGSHTKEQWEHLKAAYNYQCRICGKKEPEIKLTKDHIIPVRNGGNNDIENIQPLCRPCNSKKR